MDPLSTYNLYFNLIPSHWLWKPRETFKKLKNAQNSLREADCIFKKWSLWMWSLARMEQFSFQIKSRTSQQSWNRLRALKLCAIYPQSCMVFLTILGTTALMASSSDSTGHRYNHFTNKIWLLGPKQLLILPKFCLPLLFNFLRTELLELTATKYLCPHLHLNIRNKFSFMNVPVQLLYSLQ
jgi:hypothetical protein